MSNELKVHVCELMIDEIGNYYVMQKMFDACNEKNR